MAERDAAGDGKEPLEQRIRSIPALRLHYGHRLLVELDRRGPISLSVLLDESGDVEQLFKSDRRHRSPLDRAGQLMRYAQALGLVRQDARGALGLTSTGRRYVAAGDPGDVFATTPDQRQILREAIRRGAADGNGVAWGVALLLEILLKRPARSWRSAADLGAELARRGGAIRWREPRTFEAQAERFLALARDAELVDARNLPTDDGRALVRERPSVSAPVLPAPEERLASRPGERSPRAWIVRAGRSGVYEALALSEGVCLIGWNELGPLTPPLSREALKTRIGKVYAEARPQSLASQAGQIYRFVEEIAVGDLVVLPLMSHPRTVAVGRVSGPYEHRDDGPFAGTDGQHTRPVEWLAEHVPYTRFEPDLRMAFGQQGTVSEIGLPDAARRLLGGVRGAAPAAASGSEPSRPRPRRAVPIRPLDLSTLRAAAAAHGLELPDEVYAQAVAVLRSGKHLILTGPPGTAKTTLATAAAEAAREVGMCVGHVPTTATADWTTNETIGGLRPTRDGVLAFEEGHFVTAIAEDRWLLIDELNRSQFDRAFGQLFTVLSGHRVVLPYRRPHADGPLALVPHEDRAPREGLDVIPISPSWRIVATMNVFDKTLLFDMSFALMRRFGFVEVGCPGDETFGTLIDRCAAGDERAARLARRLLALRNFKDVGPAVYMDIARFLRERTTLDGATDEQLLFEAFYSYLLPQFEGIHGGAGARLHGVVAQLVGPERRERLRATLTAVLGLELTDDAAAEVAEEDEAVRLDAA